jgi:hypothetical protein
MKYKATTFLIILVSIYASFGWQSAQAANPPVLITEVQTGFIDANGVESPKQEFIELANVSSAAVNMTGWKLEYLSSANDGTGSVTQTIDTISGQISINGHGIWEHEGYYPIPPDSIFGVGDTSSSGFLAKSGGHVRLMNGTTMVDCVSWGSAVTIAGCDKVSAAAPAGYTLQRRLTNSTYDKSAGVANLTPATPQGNNIYSTSVTAPVITPPADPVQPTPVPDCDGLQLSEILANPAGDDAQGEFIELYNPLDHLETLYGCSLQLANGKQYAFTAADSIASKEYKAFPYSATNLQLSNSGTSVTLVMANSQITTTYPEVSDDQAWALLNGGWYLTTQPTPNTANVIYQPAKVTTTTIADTVTAELQPCPVGKYRNPDTGRCRNVVVVAPIVTCTVGQERNPLTGRCRKIAVAATPTSCQPDQTRNPDTGRCRKTDAQTTQKPCDAGQERNPDTGRCRKQTTNTGGKVLGDSITKPQTYHYLLVGTILTGVLGYAVYEYRKDFVNKFSFLKNWRSKP